GQRRPQFRQKSAVRARRSLLRRSALGGTSLAGSPQRDRAISARTGVGDGAPGTERPDPPRRPHLHGGRPRRGSRGARVLGHGSREGPRQGAGRPHCLGQACGRAALEGTRESSLIVLENVRVARRAGSEPVRSRCAASLRDCRPREPRTLVRVPRSVKPSAGGVSPADPLAAEAAPSWLRLRLPQLRGSGDRRSGLLLPTYLALLEATRALASAALSGYR